MEWYNRPVIVFKPSQCMLHHQSSRQPFVMQTNNDDHYAADISAESGDESSESLSYTISSSETSIRRSFYDEEASLPPVDRGRAAWFTLAGCFWLDGLVWGMQT